VDTDKDQERANQWKVKGLPTLWFLKSDHSKITSIPGYIDAEQFLNALKYIHTASYDKMSFQDFIKTI
jgi:thioredoxin-related protein